ncbi:BREAST CANCER SUSCEPTIBILITY 1 homolog [Olea europaea subsp. europaea]|uniref:BREAST CANCER SUSCEPTIBILITY 1 homolog n=1 Tax=Olea europaea subsp. europaea TaxID=158383 RepID=A0A8S0S9C2_OLEEU|nr:BREAST CANCER SUSCEPTIBILITY 1 homolog [Olea europaea subsp. europaea]
MADISHLERLGRELKCPICLSLLNSSVSLTCNHVFCNSCLEKSMRSASDCPVCKLPYRRREIRSAPHMDNLVSIYKSMEVASGVNICVAQTATLSKLSDEESQLDPHKICEIQDNEKAPIETRDTENQKKRQRKGLKRPLESNQKDCGSDFMKPSFPTKKRVQLPEHLSLESPTQHEKMQGRTNEISMNEPQKPHVIQKEKPVVNEMGNPVFTPFFWLREEDQAEKSSQHSDGDQVIYTPPDVPCFSDIKDSDDEVHSKTSPKGKTSVLLKSTDFIDSEMFEWTQRPCSPELCSSPIEIQVEDTEEQFGDEAAAASAYETACLQLRPEKRGKKANEKGSGKVNFSFSPSSSPLRKILNSKRGMQKPSKRVSNMTGSSKSKKSVRALSRVTGDPNELQNVTEESMQKKSGQKKTTSNLKVINSIINRNDCSEANIHERTPECIATLSDGVEPLTVGNGTALADFSASLNQQEYRAGSHHLKKCCKSCKSSEKTIALPQTASDKLKAGKLKTGNGKKASSSGKANGRCEENCNKLLRHLKKVKFSEDASEENCEDNPQNLQKKAMMERPTFGNFGANSECSLSDNPSEVEKAVSTLSGVLRKCGSFPNIIECAFCHSAEESEDCGVMFHYLKGKLVTENQDGSSDIIHVHQNCTEWAPNVFFEDDKVINLEAELTRSRRIKCCCCGIKGAALGCYEKSCRKSFHVPCAKLTLECRWDYQNFVMLCPLHTSCQLPNEMLGSHSKRNRKSVAERQSQIHQPQVTKKCESSTTLQWNCHRKTKNLVLCCSALTDVEKEIVSEFVKLSRVTILKSWDLSVTHVIASTDENGSCRRTLKFLMGILEGKWILSVEWIKACMKSGEFVNEQHYEIGVDIHGIRDGPRLGRLRLINKQPKLFDGFKFFFMGDFKLSCKGYLHDLVIAAGGKVLSRKPVSGDEAILFLIPSMPTTFIIYSLELPENCKPTDRNLILNERWNNAKSIASSTGAVVASDSWIMNSIAGHKLQNLAD